MTYEGRFVWLNSAKFGREILFSIMKHKSLWLNSKPIQ